MRRSSYGFRRFGFRPYRRFGNRRYLSRGRRRRYPMYRSMRNTSNRSVTFLGVSYDMIAVAEQPAVNNSNPVYININWRDIRLSADWNNTTALYSTFIPLYFTAKWVPNIQSNASGYYLPGVPVNNGAAITYNLFDGFATTRYDGVLSVLTPIQGIQYPSHKTFNPARNFRTIVYPRRNQMNASRQMFGDFELNANPGVSNNTINGMGFFYPQFRIAWEDSNNGNEGNLLVPSQQVQNTRLQQLGQWFVKFYIRVFDRK